jgi:hypothetical protein
LQSAQLVFFFFSLSDSCSSGPATVFFFFFLFDSSSQRSVCDCVSCFNSGCGAEGVDSLPRMQEEGEEGAPEHQRYASHALAAGSFSLPPTRRSLALSKALLTQLLAFDRSTYSALVHAFFFLQAIAGLVLVFFLIGKITKQSRWQVSGTV